MQILLKHIQRMEKKYGIEITSCFISRYLDWLLGYKNLKSPYLIYK